MTRGTFEKLESKEARSFGRVGSLIALNDLLYALVDVEKDDEAEDDERFQQLRRAESQVKCDRVAKAVDEGVAIVESDALKQADDKVGVLDQFPKCVESQRLLSVARNFATKEGAPGHVGDAPGVNGVLR